MLFETEEIPDEIEPKLRQWMRENKEWCKTKSIDLKHVAKAAQVSDAYVSDAHPTIHALDRYVISNDGREITDIDLDPEPSEKELSETVSLACFGLIGVLVSGCKILQSQASQSVDLLAREYLEMMRAQVEADEAQRASARSV